MKHEEIKMEHYEFVGKLDNTIVTFTCPECGRHIRFDQPQNIHVYTTDYIKCPECGLRRNINNALILGEYESSYDTADNMNQTTSTCSKNIKKLAEAVLYGGLVFVDIMALPDILEKWCGLIRLAGILTIINIFAFIGLITYIMYSLYKNANALDSTSITNIPKNDDWIIRKFIHNGHAYSVRMHYPPIIHITTKNTEKEVIYVEDCDKHGSKGGKIIKEPGDKGIDII